MVSINCRLLTVVPDKIARAFNKSGATRAAAFDKSKVFGKVAILVFFIKSKVLRNFGPDICPYFVFSQ